MKKICFALALLLCWGPAFGATNGFIRDDRLHVVIDNVYGLMWQDGVNIFQGGWDEARHYCENLNFAGYNDWRLPTRLELLSITDDSRITPINRAFENISKESSYWSLTKYVGDQSNVWAVDFWDGHGYAGSNIVSDKACVRCVRND